MATCHSGASSSSGVMLTGYTLCISRADELLLGESSSSCVSAFDQYLASLIGEVIGGTGAEYWRR